MIKKEDKVDKCPNCGNPKPTDEEYMNSTAQMDYYSIGDFESNIWGWHCFICNCEWLEKGLKESKFIKITKEGEHK